MLGVRLDWAHHMVFCDVIVNSVQRTNSTVSLNWHRKPLLGVKRALLDVPFWTRFGTRKAMARHGHVMTSDASVARQ